MVCSKHLNFNFLYLIKPSFFCSTLVWGLFLKSYEYFRAYFGSYNYLYILATPRIKVIQLCNTLGFPYKRSALSKKRIAVSQLDFRARKGLGTFEKQTPDNGVITLACLV